MTGSDERTVALQALITGRVQGVYYRVFAARYAQTLQLRGYVRNLRDLSVEVYAEGTKDRLDELLVHLKEGPPGARVDNIETIWTDAPGKYRTFTVVP